MDQQLLNRLFQQAAGKEFPTGVENIHPNELERFAKGLIRECLSVIDPKTGDRPYKDQTQEEFWKNQSLYLICQHFKL